MPVGEVAAALSEALLLDDGWYADYQSATEHVVVFQFGLWQGRKHVGSRIVNEPGSLVRPGHR